MNRVLLIEDDASSAKLLANYISADLPIELCIAESLVGIESTNADVVLLDLRLPPKFTADEALQKVKDIPAKVIILTASLDHDVEQKSYDAGAVAFFRKIDVIENPKLLREAILQFLPK
jgi:CheY-like chemotaxis protein